MNGRIIVTFTLLTTLLTSTSAFSIIKAISSLGERQYCATSSNSSWSATGIKTYSVLHLDNGCSLQNLPKDHQSAAVIAEEGQCSMFYMVYNTYMVRAEILIVILNEGQKLSDISINRPLKIPLKILFITRQDGNDLIDQIKSSSCTLKIESFSEGQDSLINGSELILVITAVLIVIFSAIYATEYFEFLRYGLLLRKEEEHLWHVKETTYQKPNRCATMNKIVSVLVFVVTVCILLLLLYLFYFPVVYIIIAVFVLGSCISVLFVLSPLVALLPFLKWRLPPNKFLLLKYRPDLRFFVTLSVSIALSFWWLLERKETSIWFLHNLLGACFILYVINGLINVDTWVVMLLLIIMLCYDVFFVFLTPYFSNGDNVMLGAITGTGSSDTESLVATATSAIDIGITAQMTMSYEQLPILLSAPKIFLNDFERVCNIRDLDTFLGYGDIAVPGLFISHCLKFDLLSGKSIIYFVISILGYSIGLVLAFVVLYLSSAAQPALLYIVPSCLLPVLVLAVYRKQGKAFLFQQKKDKDSSDFGDDKDLQLPYNYHEQLNDKGGLIYVI